MPTVAKRAVGQVIRDGSWAGPFSSEQDLGAWGSVITLVALATLGAWLLVLGVGRTVERLAGPRAGTIAARFLWALAGVTLIASFVQSWQNGPPSIASGAPYRGIDLVCWGHHDPAACHARAEVMIDSFARSHPHLTPIAVHIGRADQLCYRGDDETACIALD